MLESLHEPVHLSRACRSVIPDYYGQRVSPQTAMRWVNKGLKSADGTVVKLKAYRAGRQLLTSRLWIEEFFDELARRSGVPSQLEAARLNEDARQLYGESGRACR